MVSYLIIGNSVGAVGAVEAIREVDQKGTLTIVSEEPYPVYSRPRISEYLAGESTLEEMSYRPPDFYDRNAVETILGQKAIQVDVNKKTVRLEDGREIPWEKLLLATGGIPFVPRMEGLDKEGIFTFTTLGDAQRLAAWLSPAHRQAVVIGGGLIGISASEALVKRGLEVTVVELKDWILNTILDEEAARLAERTLKDKGLRFLTGHTVQSILGKPDDPRLVGGVRLASGQEMPCDMLVTAIGVVPRTELAANTPIQVNRGIVVDDHMATSAAGVYACGDVAETFDFLYGTKRVIPIWPNAHIEGRIAGYNMAGREARYAGGVAMNSLNYFGLPIVSAGIYDPPQGDYETIIVRDPARNVYKKAVLKDDHLVGMILVGEIDKAGILMGLIRDQIKVEGFKEHLLAPDFGFIHFPAAMRAERRGQNGRSSGSPSLIAKGEALGPKTKEE